VKIKQWINEKGNGHYFVYFSVTFLLYIVNFFKVNGSGGQWAFANELIFTTLFVLILLRYNWRSFLNPISYVWILIMLIAFPFAFRLYKVGTDYDFQLIGRYINVVLCGIVVIRVLFFYSKENFAPLKSHHMIVWWLMIFFCVISKSSSTWPICALILYGTFYYAPMSEDERYALISGVVDAIIVSFFVYQGHALLFCPYDYVRYRSFFSNSDCSAKFFTVSYIGFLVKLFMARRNKCRVVELLCVFFAVCMWSFLLFTMTRSGFIGMFLVTLGFVYCLIKTESVSLVQIIRNGVICIMVFVVTVPLVYCLIRYVPALRHHPVYISGYTEERVHSWDPIDSEKYVSAEDVINVLLSRVNVTDSQEEPIDDSSSTKIASIRTLSENGERVIAYYDGVKPGTDSEHPIYIKISFNSPLEKILGIRKYIFATFWESAGWFGNVEEYPTFWVMTDWVYPSAHNSLLDFTVKYGYVAGVLYGILQILVIFDGIRFIRNNPSDDGLRLMLFCALGYFGWGLFYSVSITGEINDTLFWITLGLCRNKKPDLNAITELAESRV